MITNKFRTASISIATVCLIAAPLSGNPALGLDANTESQLLGIAQPIQDKSFSDLINKPKYDNYAASFAGVTINLDSASLDLYWKGPLPTEISSILASGTSSLSIKVHDADFSIRDLDQAKEKLISLLESKPNIHKSLIIPNPDGSNLILEIENTDYPALTDFLAEYNALSPVPLVVELGVPMGSSLVSRRTDTAPYSGGSLIGIGQQSFQNYCSSGFGVKSASTSVDYIITANHCFHNSLSYTTANIYSGANSSGNFDGHSLVGTWQNTSGYNKPSMDVSVYRPSPGTSANTIFTGGVTSSSQVAISGSKNAVIGQTVCSNGAMSGAQCTLTVTTVNTSGVFTNGDGSTFTIASNVYIASAPTGGIAVASGDSGGPVYDYQNGSYVGVGLITAGAGQFSCPVITGTCYSSVIFTGLTTDLATINMALK